MKLLFVALLAIVATAESLECVPNSAFQYYCNTCWCSANGKDANCTTIVCDYEMWNMDGTRKSKTSVEPKFKESERICEPGSTFKDYCNSCLCSRDGKTAACTLMDCDPRVWNKDGTLRSDPELDSVQESKSDESDRICEPHTQFKDYCNTCWCSADGKHAACTLMGCDLTVWNKDGTLKTKISNPSKIEGSELICEPHSTFKDYCNTCKCSANGKNAVCTLMACDPRVWNKDGTMKIATESTAVEESVEVNRKTQKCEPGKAYSPDGCNTCICSEDGSESACTLKLCISNLIQTHSDKETQKWGPRYNQGDRCTPRESFYSECNMCICSHDGKSAFCTLMIC